MAEPKHIPYGPRVLVTRPKEDAATLTAALKAKGMEVLVEPLMTILPEEGAKPRIFSLMKEKPQAVLITSANGIRAFAKACEERDALIMAVGEASSEEAKRLGFKNVKTADGDAKSLAALVVKTLKPADGVLLHIAGSVTAGDLKGDLGKAGFAVERVVSYRADAVSSFSPELKAALVNCELEIATFFSPRTLNIFDRLIDIADHGYLLRHVELVVLSDEVTSKHQWKKRHVAAASTTAAMLDLIDRLQ